MTFSMSDDSSRVPYLRSLGKTDLGVADGVALLDCAPEQFAEPVCIGRRRALLIVVEVDVNFASYAFPAPDARSPIEQFGRLVPPAIASACDPDQCQTPGPTATAFCPISTDNRLLRMAAPEPAETPCKASALAN